MLGYFGGFWDTWNASHKVTFDLVNKLILINEGVTFLNVQRDLYSDMKEWMLFTENNNKKRRPGIVSVGGDPISDTKKLGDTYFLENGWRIKPWDGHTSITIEGNIYTREGVRPIVPDNNGIDAVTLEVSVLTNTVIVDTAEAIDTDAPIWDSVEGIANAYQNGSTINISWGRATDANPVSYNIYMSTFDVNLFSPANLFTTVDGYFSTLTGLDNDVFADGVTYYIGVRAIDILGNETQNTNYASVVYEAQVIQAVVNETTIHTALDSYTNKDAYKADANNLAIDLTPVLDAIAALNDATPAEIRAAFNAVDFQDKNTELEVHTWLDTYINKADWKESSDLTATNAKIDAVQTRVDAVPTATENADALLTKVI